MGGTWRDLNPPEKIARKQEAYDRRALARRMRAAKLPWKFIAAELSVCVQRARDLAGEPLGTPPVVKWMSAGADVNGHMKTAAWRHMMARIFGPTGLATTALAFSKENGTFYGKPVAWIPDVHNPSKLRMHYFEDGRWVGTVYACLVPWPEKFPV